MVRSTRFSDALKKGDWRLLVEVRWLRSLPPALSRSEALSRFVTQTAGAAFSGAAERAGEDRTVFMASLFGLRPLRIASLSPEIYLSCCSD